MCEMNGPIPVDSKPGSEIWVWFTGSVSLLNFIKVGMSPAQVDMFESNLKKIEIEYRVRSEFNLQKLSKALELMDSTTFYNLRKNHQESLGTHSKLTIFESKLKANKD